MARQMMHTEGAEPARTCPADGRVTGFSHPQCYAQSLGDCDTELTAEHFVSKAILDQFEEGLQVSGMPWQAAGESKVLTSSTLKARVLCRRHNNGLGELDNRIDKLFATLRQLEKTLSKRDEDVLRALQIHKAYWGQDLERWMLKTYLGNVFSGNVVYKGQKIPRGTPIPSDQVRALFCPEPWPAEWGLYVVTVIGTKWRKLDGIALVLQWDEQAKRLKSFQIEMMGVPFILYLETPPGELRPNLMHRPKRLESKVGEAAKHVRLQW